MTDLITIAAFTAIALGIFLLGQLLTGRGRNRTDNILNPPLIFGPLTHPLSVIVPALESKQAVKQDLRRAGYYKRFATEEFLALRNVLVVGWVLLVATVLLVFDEPGKDLTMPILIVGGVVLIICYSLPRLILKSQATSRLQRIQFSLPDAVDMITMAMTGGLPLQHALAHVTKEIDKTYPDLACELAILSRQTETGSLDQGLEQFAARIDIPDVQSLAALVSQTERLGSNVLMALTDYSDGVRRQQRQRAEEMGNTSTIKLLFPIVLCLAPAVYVLLLGPAVVELRKFVVEQNEPGGAFSQPRGDDVATAISDLLPAGQQSAGATDAGS